MSSADLGASPGSTARGGILARRTAALLLSMVVASCANYDPKAEYDRHGYSRLEESTGPDGGYVFTTRAGGKYPENDPAAEQIRMGWIDQWMGVRGYCPSGFEVVNRGPYPAEASNPYRHDLRYELRCL